MRGFWGHLAGTERADDWPVLSGAETLNCGLFRAAWMPATTGRDRVWAGVEQDFAVVFHGECYNLAEFAVRAGCAAAADFPLIARCAYERWGDVWATRLEGLFAVVWWDPHKAILGMYREAFGARSLYRRDSAGGIAFATSLETLRAWVPDTRSISSAGLQEYLRFFDISPPNTPYSGIVAIPAGVVSVHAPGRGWTAAPIQVPSPAESRPTRLAAVTELRKVLADAVAQRLRDAVRPAVFLSGGIDSSLLAALAKSVRPDIEAVTVGFATPPYDESTVARGIAQHLKLRHSVLTFTRSDYVQAFERWSAGSELPSADPAALATLLCFEHCAKQYDLVLDGTGADTLLGVMPARHVRLASAYSALLPRSWRQALVRISRSLPILSRFVPLFDFEHPAELLMRWNGFRRSEIEVMTGGPADLESLRFYRRYAEFPRSAHFARYSSLLGGLPDDRLHQASAMTGLAVRFPYDAPQVSESIHALPMEFRYTSAEPKRILRWLLSDYVPRELWDLPKHGFDFPFCEFLRDEDFRLVRRYLGDTNVLAGTAGLRLEPVAQYCAACTGPHRHAFRIWGLVVLSAWLEAHAA